MEFHHISIPGCHKDSAQKSLEAQKEVDLYLYEDPSCVHDSLTVMASLDHHSDSALIDMNTLKSCHTSHISGMSAGAALSSGVLVQGWIHILLHPTYKVVYMAVQLAAV